MLRNVVTLSVRRSAIVVTYQNAVIFSKQEAVETSNLVAKWPAGCTRTTGQ